MGLNITALYAAIASLKDDEFVNNSVKWNSEAKDYVYGQLKALDLSYVPSYTSFVLFPITQEGKPFLEKMFAKKIGVRAFQIFNQSYCRVSIGTMKEMELFSDALKQVIA